MGVIEIIAFLTTQKANFPLDWLLYWMHHYQCWWKIDAVTLEQWWMDTASSLQKGRNWLHGIQGWNQSRKRDPSSVLLLRVSLFFKIFFLIWVRSLKTDTVTTVPAVVCFVLSYWLELFLSEWFMRGCESEAVRCRPRSVFLRADAGTRCLFPPSSWCQLCLAQGSQTQFTCEPLEVESGWGFSIFNKIISEHTEHEQFFRTLASLTSSYLIIKNKNPFLMEKYPKSTTFIFLILFFLWSSVFSLYLETLPKHVSSDPHCQFMLLPRVSTMAHKY